MTWQTDMAGCLVEISQSAADNNLRLTHLENEILRHVECGRGGDTSVRRRGIVLCDSEEVADALLRWMKRGCQSLATLTLNPEKLNLPSKKSYCGKCIHNSTSRIGCAGHYRLARCTVQCMVCNSRR